MWLVGGRDWDGNDSDRWHFLFWRTWLHLGHRIFVGYFLIWPPLA